jgi:phosphoenolpyruvate-protein kinase (PTS system EI component)
MGRYNRNMRRIGLILAIACGLALGVPQQASTPTLSEVDQLLLALSDITWFNNIRPLNLTKTQIERLIPAHERAYKQLERLIQEEAKELRNRKDEILRIREDTARGKSLPKEFLETIKRLETDAAQKRRQLRAQVVSEVATELKPNFTDEQFQYMVKRSKEVLEAARVDVAQLKDDQLYALFIESVFLDPRAPELLKEWQRKNVGQ